VRKQTERRKPNFRNRCQNNAEGREFYGCMQGRAEDNNFGRLNPNAQQFNPHVGVAPVNLDRSDRNQHNEAQTLNN
jgi:hypothetical protein